MFKNGYLILLIHDVFNYLQTLSEVVKFCNYIRLYYKNRNHAV